MTSEIGLCDEQDQGLAHLGTDDRHELVEHQHEPHGQGMSWDACEHI